MQKEQLLKKILVDGILERDAQLGEYRQYFDTPYNYETCKYDDAVEMPDNLIIFWSRYTYENYSGDGEVWGYNTDNQMFFNVSGDHCSCYGLEGQWDEEYYTYDEMVNVLERVTNPEYVWDQSKVDDQIQLLKMVKGED